MDGERRLRGDTTGHPDIIWGISLALVLWACTGLISEQAGAQVEVVFLQICSLPYTVLGASYA